MFHSRRHRLAQVSQNSSGQAVTSPIPNHDQDRRYYQELIFKITLMNIIINFAYTRLYNGRLFMLKVP